MENGRSGTGESDPNKGKKMIVDHKHRESDRHEIVGGNRREGYILAQKKGRAGKGSANWLIGEQSN